MSVPDLQRAMMHVHNAIELRDQAAGHEVWLDPESQAECARLSRLADRSAEFAIGALKNDLGQENSF